MRRIAMIFIEAINEGSWQFGMWKGEYYTSSMGTLQWKQAKPEEVNAAEH
jgi:hypothetical protein